VYSFQADRIESSQQFSEKSTKKGGILLILIKFVKILNPQYNWIKIQSMEKTFLLQGVSELPSHLSACSTREREREGYFFRPFLREHVSEYKRARS